MKKFAKLFVLILAICQIVGCLSSCSLLGKIIDLNKEEESTEESTFVLTKEILSQYVIVTPNGDDSMTNVARTLQRNLKDTYGVELQIKDDFLILGAEDTGESEYEILVGYTDRKECKEYYADVRINDTGYALVGKKLLMLGYSNTAVSESVALFRSDVLRQAEGKDTVMQTENNKIVSGIYDNDTFLLNGVNIGEYTIIYPNACVKGEYEIATYLQYYITALTGYVVRCEDDITDPTQYEIQIGDTSRITEDMKSARDSMGYKKTQAYIGKLDNGLWLYGNGKSGFYAAFSKLLKAISVNDKTVSIDIAASECENIQELDLSVMEYNVYFDLKETKRDPQDVITTVKQKSPDIFGLNEAGTGWIALFKADSEISSKYDCAEGKAAEKSADTLYNPIFYRKDKFELVEVGTKWLSGTPDRMSMFPGAKHYKIMTYVILKDKATGTEFMYINAHLDGSNEVDAQVDLATVRFKQSQVINDFAANYTHLPIVMGGDFNDAPSSSTVRKITNNTRFKYCMDAAKSKVDIGTTKTVSSNFNPLDKGSVLDYMFVTTDSVTVKLYEQVDNSYRDAEGKITGCPSDHLPVYAEVSISY